jgi:ribonuclease HI
MSKAYRTVSSDAINVICNLMPLVLVIKKLSIEYYVKKGIESETVNEYLAEYNLDLEKVQRPFRSECLPHPSLRKRLNFTESICDNTVIYTCGSVSIEGVGAAYLVLCDNNVKTRAKFKLSYYCTSFQAELYSILQALKYTNQKLYSNKNITIIYQSESVRKALQDINSSTYLVKLIMEEERNSRLENIKVNFCLMNELQTLNGSKIAMILAKEAQVSHKRLDYDMIPISYIKKLIYDKSISIWNENWATTPNGVTTRQYIPTITERLKMKKYFSTNFFLTQILTDHGKFNSYLTKFKIRSDPYCDVCVGKMDNSEHVVYECLKFQEKREEMKAQMGCDWPQEKYEFLNSKLFEIFNLYVQSIFK